MSILRNKLVLIVEDEALIGLELIIALEARGASALIAKDPGSGLALMDGRRFTAAILDAGTDERTGKLCERLQELEIPFVLHSGAGSDCVAAATVIPKPAHPETVIRELERAAMRASSGEAVDGRNVMDRSGQSQLR